MANRTAIAGIKSNHNVQHRYRERGLRSSAGAEDKMRAAGPGCTSHGDDIAGVLWMSAAVFSLSQKRVEPGFRDFERVVLRLRIGDDEKFLR